MKRRIHLLAILLAVSLLAGCGGSSKEYAAYDSAATESASMQNGKAESPEMEMVEDSIAAGTEISEVIQENRKLIRTFDIQIQTKEFEEVVAGIQVKVQELGGYIESSSLDGGSVYYDRYNRYSRMTVRIPSDELDSFVANVKETANVTHISEDADDVTLQYVDVESHKAALETEQARLLELLEMAETVDDIIMIESRLSEVRYQLESYTSQLRTLDNLVDYSTVHIDISEVDRETKVEPKTFWEEVTSDFSDSIYDVGRGFRNFAIWFLGSSPYLVLWAVIIAVIVFVLKLFGRKRRMKRILKETKPEEKPEEK